MKNTLTVREEANAITCFAFRNGYLEELHAGKYSSLLESQELSRITDDEMKKLMIEASANIEKLLRMKQDDPKAYLKLIESFNETYTKNWQK